MKMAQKWNGGIIIVNRTNFGQIEPVFLRNPVRQKFNRNYDVPQWCKEQEKQDKLVER